MAAIACNTKPQEANIQMSVSNRRKESGSCQVRWLPKGMGPQPAALHCAAFLPRSDTGDCKRATKHDQSQGNENRSTGKTAKYSKNKTQSATQQKSISQTSLRLHKTTNDVTDTDGGPYTAKRGRLPPPPYQRTFSGVCRRRRWPPSKHWGFCRGASAATPGASVAI